MQADHPPRFIQFLQLFGLLAVLFWRWATPFWRFRDVNFGTLEQRSANYRHNRAQRAILPSYTLKWLGIAGFMLFLLQIYSGRMAQAMEGTAAYFCAALFCVSSGIMFSQNMVSPLPKGKRHRRLPPPRHALYGCSRCICHAPLPSRV